MEGTDGGDGEGFLEGVDANVGEVGGVVPIRHGGLQVRIVDQHLHETQRQNPFKRLSYTPRLRAVDSYGEHLRFLFPRYFVRESRQPPCK